MNILLRLLYGFSPVPVLSINAAIIFLAFPLMIQTIIDKVISQNSPDTLAPLIIFVLVIGVFGLTIELFKQRRIDSVTNNSDKRKKIAVEIWNKLPRIVILLIVIFIYSPLMSVITILMSVFAPLIIYSIWDGLFIRRKNNNISSKPYSSYMSICFHSMTIYMNIILFGIGSYLVLDGQLTLGMTIAYIIISLELLDTFKTLTINLMKFNKIESSTSTI